MGSPLILSFLLSSISFLWYMPSSLIFVPSMQLLFLVLVLVALVESDALWLHELQFEFLRPWKFSGDNPGVGCHSLGDLPPPGDPTCVSCIFYALARQILYNQCHLVSGSVLLISKGKFVVFLKTACCIYLLWFWRILMIVLLKFFIFVYCLILPS